MEFQKSIIELIKIRTSSRTYDGREIDTIALQKLNTFIMEINAEKIINGRFILAQKSHDVLENGQKLGTYGVILGAQSYIVGALEMTEKDAQSFGYLFEKVVLYATELGIQTCWLGGTFKKSDFEKSIVMPENEVIVMVSPIGYKKEKPRIFESVMRSVVGANNRKPWNELFFNANYTPMTEQLAGLYAVPLEMVRLGPSASNKQPWRVIHDENRFDFFLCRTKGYGVKNFDLQKNDMGIAKCHFELSANELGLVGEWQDIANMKAKDDWEYAFSWKMEA